MRWAIGSVTITKVPEFEFAVPLDGLLVGMPHDAVDRFDWLAPNFVNGRGDGLLSFHGFVVESDTHRVLIDTCIGEMRQGIPAPPMPSPFLDNLGESGYGPDDIDIVVCTHLHFDHVGWNTRWTGGRWQLTFPKATYLFVNDEYKHWLTEGSEYSNFDETVQPVFDAGAALLVENNHRVTDEVRLLPTPGHTPGHVSVAVESRTEKAVITGDLAHHPVQFALTDIGMAADDDSARAADTRRRFLDDCAADGSLLLGSHFAGSTGGRVSVDGEGWRLDPWHEDG